MCTVHHTYVYVGVCVCMDTWMSVINVPHLKHANETRHGGKFQMVKCYSAHTYISKANAIGLVDCRQQYHSPAVMWAQSLISRVHFTSSCSSSSSGPGLMSSERNIWGGWVCASHDRMSKSVKWAVEWEMNGIEKEWRKRFCCAYVSYIIFSQKFYMINLLNDIDTL